MHPNYLQCKIHKFSITISKIVFLTISAGCCFFSEAQIENSRLLWFDDFTNQNSRWEWSYHAGTGYRKLTTIDTISALEIGITDQSSSATYSDCSIHENTYTITNGIVEMRLRYQGDGKPGTMGWGFWNYEDPSNPDAAWFWNAHPQGGLSGFQVQVAYSQTIQYQKKISDVNLSQWHIYKVELHKTGVNFYIDDVLIGSTDKRPKFLQRIEIWVDNMNIVGNETNGTPLGNRTVTEQKIFIDWVKFSEINKQAPNLRQYLRKPQQKKTIVPLIKKTGMKITFINFDMPIAYSAIRVYDLKGFLIANLTNAIIALPNDPLSTFVLDTDDIPVGTYILNMVIGEKSFNQQFVISN